MIGFKRIKPVSVGAQPQFETIVKEINVNSGTWVFISEWLKKERAALMETNNSVGRDAVETAYIRGQIRTLDRLLSLPEKRETIFEKVLKNG